MPKTKSSKKTSSKKNLSKRPSSKKASSKKGSNKDFCITVTKGGPYLVTGNLPLSKEIIVSNSENEAVTWKKGDRYPNKETYALCRCGHSSNKPFCDGTHINAKFDGTETASKRKYLEQAKLIEGPTLNLTDAESFCIGAGFCDRLGGTWNLTRSSDVKKAKQEAIKQACDCPSGRLVVWDKKTNKPIEPRFIPSISLIEDPGAQASGPLWVKGNVPIISAEGTRYEIRNRCTLCRCGASQNKPFCDSRHVSLKFNDGDKSLK